MKNKSKTLAIVIGVLGVLCIGGFFIFNMLKKNTYTITFDSDGGTVIASVVVEEGQKLIKPTDPTKEGYEFLNWTYNNLAYDFNWDVKEDMTLKALWKQVVIEPDEYEVTFTLDGTTKTVTTSDFKSIDFDSLGFKEKDGHIIVWTLDGEEYDGEKPLTDNISLEGKYVKVSSFTVKFNSDGGSKVDNQTVKEGEKAKEPTKVTKEGYVLDGWYLNSEKYDFNKKVTKNITLTAKWSEDPNIKRYTVSFDSTGGSKVNDQRIMENKTASEPKAPTKKGFVFVSWNYNNKKFDFKTKITEDIKLVATWREQARFKVTFIIDGSSQVHEVNEGETVSEPVATEKNGYTFKEWQLNGKKYDFKTPVTADITITAVYEQNKKKDNFRVEFDTDGGTPGVATQLIESGSRVMQPTVNPSKSGYTFVAWQLNGVNFNFQTLISENITLKAAYRKNDEQTPATTYTVTFNSDGGSTVPSQTIASGGKATRPANPTKDGSTFDDWYLGDNVFDFNNTTVTGDITLTARWIIRPTVTNYTVTFESDGGSSVPTQTVASGSTATRPTDPTKSGNTFAGWKDSNGNDYNFSTPVTGNITLTASWNEVVTYTLKTRSVGVGAVQVYVDVYRNGEQVTDYRGIDAFCVNKNPCVTATAELANKTSFSVVLANGNTVTATLVQ